MPCALRAYQSNPIYEHKCNSHDGDYSHLALPLHLPCGCIPGGTPKGTRSIASLSPGRLASDVGGGTPTGGAVWGSPVFGLSCGAAGAGSGI
jgi:hypothetical protein